MKLFCITFGAVLIITALLSIPIGFVYFVYCWSVDDMDAKAALWEATKHFLYCASLYIPGAILYSIGNQLNNG